VPSLSILAHQDGQTHDDSACAEIESALNSFDASPYRLELHEQPEFYEDSWWKARRSSIYIICYRRPLGDGSNALHLEGATNYDRSREVGFSTVFLYLRVLSGRPATRKLPFSYLSDGVGANGVLKAKQVSSQRSADPLTFWAGIDFLGNVKTRWTRSPFSPPFRQSPLRKCVLTMRTYSEALRLAAFVRNLSDRSSLTLPVRR